VCKKSRLALIMIDEMPLSLMQSGLNHLLNGVKRVKPNLPPETGFLRCVSVV